MKLSVTSYSFFQYIRAGKMTLLDTVEKAREMGFDGMEFTTLPTELSHDERLALAKDLRKRAEECGLPIVNYATGAKLWQPTDELLAAEIEKTKREVDIAAALGSPLMRHDLVFSLEREGTGRGFFAMLPTIARATREITEYAETLGIRTCSENHGRVAQDSNRMEAVVSAVDHKNYGLLVDFGNFLCADEDPAIAVSRVANYAMHAHAKDMKILPYTPTAPEGAFYTRSAQYLRATAIGHGDVPVERCLSILRYAGYHGYVTVEYEGKADCLYGIEEGRRNLLAYLKEIGEFEG